MADLSIGGGLSGLGSVIGGIGSLVGGMEASAADKQEAQDFGIAAQYATQNAYLSGEAGEMQGLGMARKIQQTQGAQVATAAANGLKTAGSALSAMRDTVAQGALAEGQIGLQTSINVNNFQEQAEAFTAQQQAANAAASAASSGGIFGLLGGIVGGAAKLFAL